MQWYYVANNQRQGPIAQAEFERLAADGTISTDTLVWREGMSEWLPYGKVVPAAAAPDPVTGEETQVCAVSGKRYPVREMIQYEGRWISAEHRNEYFQRLREGVIHPGAEGVPGPFGYGGFWRRFLARLVDGLILWVVNMIVSMLLMMPLGASMRLQGRQGSANFGMVFLVEGLILLINFGIGIGYEILFIRKFDATPGKMALGVKLVRADGSKLSVGRIVGRYFAYALSAMILAIGLIMAGVDEEKRGLHDRMCDTRVVKTRA